MFESDQDAEESDQMFVCPYDSSHTVTASRMRRHLIKCRKNFLVSEKAICPFNDEHVIFAPEMDYHKLVCPDKAEGKDHEEAFEEMSHIHGQNPSPVHERLESSSSESFHSSDQETAMNSTGCESGLDVVGGIRNCVSFIRETGEVGSVAFSKGCKSAVIEENDQPRNGIKVACHDVVADGLVSPMAELESPNHNIPIEKQLEQSESDTASSGTNSSIGYDEGLLGEERFDYTKYIPSKDLREDFLKMIRQAKDVQVHDEKYQMIGQPYGPEVWPQGGYSFHPSQFQATGGFQSPAIQPAYVSYPSTYPMVPPYTGPYGFSNQLPGPGSFLQGPDQGLSFEYGVYPVTRQHYHRSYYRRRNHYNSFSPRHSNHNNYNCHNHESHAESPLNDSNHSELSKMKEGPSVHHVNGSSNHDDPSSNSRPLAVHTRNGYNKKHPLSFPIPGKTSHCMENTNNDVDIQQFVDIGENRSVNGDLSDECSDSFHGAEEAMDGQLDDDEKSEYKKQIRKLRKKLCEIDGLEEKRCHGAKLDCDQLKKLSRKREFEEQLRSLTLC